MAPDTYSVYRFCDIHRRPAACEMVPRVPAFPVGYCCRVNLARGCSLLTPRQINYTEEFFDLKNPNTTFDFMFRLYNLVSLANEDNTILSNAPGKVAKLYSAVKQMGLQSITSITSNRKRTRVDGNAGDRPSKKPRNNGGSVESDILSDVAILEALERAGYTIPEEVEGFKVLLPVRVSFL
jgi:hypothetical protein